MYVLSKCMVKKTESGQILLIVVLTMIVALTVGLSIASRTITELKLSRQNEESQRAFQAAEAGIEQSLQQQQSIVGEFSNNNSSFTTSLTFDTGATILLNNGQEVDQGVGADVWLSTYSSDPVQLYSNPLGGGSPVAITIYWGTSEQTTCAVTGGRAVLPSLEIVLLSGAIQTPSVQKYVFEPTTCSRIPGSTKIVSVPTTIRDVIFSYSTTLNITNGRILKVIPIYNSAVIGASAANTAVPPQPISFPSQGSIVESTGSSGDTVRKVLYYQSYPQLPLEVFPYTILSQ